jgi:RsiW-degrading membrane proteinase PrsW (M82 family)
MGTQGTAWLATCVALAAIWVLALSWRSKDGTAPTAARGVLGGLAALGTAFILYGLMQAAGLDIRWEWIERGAWPALGFAALIGLVEEVAKAAGIALASPALFQRGRERSVLYTAASVTAVFAIAEALLTVRGASWPIALGRAALGPVAHGVLAAPTAVALAYAAGTSRARLALRLMVAIGLAALLHGLGDWSVARPGWGRMGFAAVLLVPTFWLYACARSARVRRQIGGRLFSPYPVSST